MPRSAKAAHISSPAKAFDVIAPGKAVPAPSGRPIIVTNRPMIKDPMAPASPATAKAVGTTLLEPSGVSRTADPVKPPAETPAPVKAANPAPTPAPVSPEEPATPHLPETAPTDSIMDADDEGHPTEKAEAGATDEPQKEADQAQQAAQAAQEKVITSKQYYLPISNGDRRRDTRTALLILMLVLIGTLVWLDLVLDAGIVHIPGIHAVTHIFSSR